MTERELFEAWLRKNTEKQFLEITFRKDENGEFNYTPTRYKWEAWQASASRDGYKLVPVEIIDAIDWHIKHRKYGCIFLSVNNAGQ